MQGLSSHRDRVRISVDHKITYFKAHLLRLFRGGPSKLGSNPGKKLWHTKRLCQVVIGAFVEGLHLHHIRVANAEHNDWDPVESTYGLREFKTVHLRHGQVRDNQVRLA